MSPEEKGGPVSRSPGTDVETLRDASDQEVALVDLVNRILDRGLVVSGDVLISVAGIDLVEIGLHLYVASTETAEMRRREGADWREAIRGKTAR